MNNISKAIENIPNPNLVKSPNSAIKSSEMYRIMCIVNNAETIMLSIIQKLTIIVGYYEHLQ